jgi:hypothetical protein
VSGSQRCVAPIALAINVIVVSVDCEDATAQDSAPLRGARLKESSGSKGRIGACGIEAPRTALHARLSVTLHRACAVSGPGRTAMKGPRSGPGYAVLDHHHLIDPIRPTRGHIAISSHSAYTRCLRCAGAPRRPASGSGLSLSIPSWHAILYRPRGLQHRQFQTTTLTSPSPRDQRLGIPNIPAIRFTRGNHFGASQFTHSLRPASLLAPLYGSDQFLAVGGFYFQASGVSVTLPAAGYDYNSDWTLLLAGLPPAGMTASLAARSPWLLGHKVRLG